MKRVTKIIASLFLGGLLLTSCSDDNNIVQALDGKAFEGVIVSAEGAFGKKDGSVSYIEEDLSGSQNFIYSSVNGAQLGGLIQSITFNGNLAYIILNDVNQIVVVNRTTFKKVATISTGLGNPRYMAVIGNKGYVTNWGDGATTTDDYVAVINLTTNTITPETISLENGVEQIIAKDNKLYVSHKGAFTTNNIVSVIDTANGNSVVKITVKDNPDELFFNDNGDLVVLSEGNSTFGGAPNYEFLGVSTSSIQFINTTTNTVTKSLDFGKNISASLMTYENGTIYYYTNNTVYQISDSATALASSGANVGNIYGMTIKEGQLYTVEYAFTKLSKLNVVNPTDGVVSYSTAVGLGASKIYFNN